ncbi:isochorismatase family protein [Methylomonas sp. EFPC3]|uniref:isochorismatase family protein n=1 Tax=Methylomonas sp. EFPC3 TaxID=3021710 RepID=UPI0024171042|nr:isochorismatase family protein [Methylomonas sp. EFPC3]WFP50544.1 isochorismatase family protein [Methylomonas sp. EFPC3]
MSIPNIPSYEMPTELPAAKVQWHLDPSRAVLLVHDMQQYFLDFYDPSLAPIPTLMENCIRLIAACRSHGVPILYTAQRGGQSAADRALLTDFWGPGLPAQAALERIADAIVPEAGDEVLPKSRYSAFKRSDLEQRLRAMARDQLVICGIYAHIGCLMTAAEAFMLDIQPFLAGDALADFSREEHGIALRYAAGRCASVCSSQDIVTALTSPYPSLQALRHEVAAAIAIEPHRLGDHDDLLLMGLDSIALMTLLQGWRQRGLQADFGDLAPTPTLAAWHGLWQGGSAIAAAGS